MILPLLKTYPGKCYDSSMVIGWMRLWKNVYSILAVVVMIKLKIIKIKIIRKNKYKSSGNNVNRDGVEELSVWWCKE